MKKLLFLSLSLILLMIACVPQYADDDDDDVVTPGSKIPVALEAENIGAESFDAIWLSLDANDVFDLYISQDKSFSNIIQTYTNLSAFSQTVNGLMPTQRYFYRVKSIHAGMNKVSNIIEVQTRPYGPVADSATFIGPNGFQANWGPVDPVDHYIFQLATDAVFNNPHPYYDNIMVGDTLRNIHSLNSNTTYYYRVKAKIGSQISDYSNTITVKTQ